MNLNNALINYALAYGVDMKYLFRRYYYVDSAKFNINKYLVLNFFYTESLQFKTRDIPNWQFNTEYTYIHFFYCTHCFYVFVIETFRNINFEKKCVILYTSNNY